MFYDRYKELCAKKGVSASKAAQEIGIEKSLVPKWKQKGFTPRAETLNKIAAYFNVTTDYLLGQDNTATEDGDGTVAEFTASFARLDDAHQQAVLSLIKSLLNSQ